MSPNMWRFFFEIISCCRISKVEDRNMHLFLARHISKSEHFLPQWYTLLRVCRKEVVVFGNLRARSMDDLESHAKSICQICVIYWLAASSCFNNVRSDWLNNNKNTSKQLYTTYKTVLNNFQCFYKKMQNNQIITFYSEAYLEPSRTFKMELFCKKVGYFQKKVSP